MTFERLKTSFGLVTAAALFGSIPTASAETVFDQYIGAQPTSSYNQKTDPNDTDNAGDPIYDVIGDTRVFSIRSADVTRIDGTNTLSVKIDTGFAGMAGTSAGVNQEYGSLFLGDDFAYNNLGAKNGSSPGNSSSEDIYYNPANGGSGDLDRYSLAAYMPGDPHPPNNISLSGGDDSSVYLIDPNSPTNGGLVDIDPTAGVNNKQTADVKLSATVTGGLQRKYQAWTVDPTGADAIGSSTWSYSRASTSLNSTDTYIEFTIADFFGSGNLLETYVDKDGDGIWVASWAMSCANDIANYFISGNFGANPVPLPAGLVLLLSGLLGLGFLGRYKSKHSS